MTRFAVLSDIDGNLEALTAVLADIEKQGVSEVYNLGNTVGYGPDPVACLAELEKYDGSSDQGLHITSIEGRHEKILREALQSKSPVERTFLAYVQEQLEQLPHSQDIPDDYIQLIDLVLYHSSPNRPKYTKGGEQENAADIFRQLTKEGYRGMVVGMTGVPVLYCPQDELEVKPGFTWSNSNTVHTNSPFILNPGSVGRPLDGNAKAKYAIVHGDCITFHAVKYDVEETISKSLRSINALVDAAHREGVQDQARSDLLEYQINRIRTGE